MQALIRHRHTNEIIYQAHVPTDELDPRLYAVSMAVALKISLAYADLRDGEFAHLELEGIDLSHALLDGADFSDTHLRDAKLSGASLKGALLNKTILEGADLSGADLEDAQAIDAVLTGANLTAARLVNTNLLRADLRQAVLTNANLFEAWLLDAKLSGSTLIGAKFDDLTIPQVRHIDARIRAEITNDPTRLDMLAWRSFCHSTRHSRAGWAVVLAGQDGIELAQDLGEEAAAALIYAMSRPARAVPDFSQGHKAALADIEAAAGEDPIAAV